MFTLWIQAQWQKRGLFALLMLPLAGLYCLVMALRRRAYGTGLIKSFPIDCPVIVVGNVSVGGTGKTPLVMWLVQNLVDAGYRPGVISRGYGGSATDLPMMLADDTPASVAGDEPVMIFRKTGRPVVIAPDRIAAADMLLSDTDCNVIVSDDGLQHLRLQRDIEIAVITSDRIAGNGWCLPAGPLREPSSVLDDIDITVTRAKQSGRTNWQLKLKEDDCVNVASPGERRALESFSGSTIHAVAGIGNPDDFFASLRAAGLDIIEHRFPDHHAYKAADLEFSDDLAVIMTEKDAVKCLSFASPDWWSLTVSVVVDEGILNNIVNKLEEIDYGG
ncbi:MAG TPA: tetraacyldisaccharide 4'-kinase [Gammaproteobacteria bacterium]|nr:tetraacyldisaccharide 4'-kinase [Gammaproteobacteria bacterium]